MLDMETGRHTQKSKHLSAIPHGSSAQPVKTRGTKKRSKGRVGRRKTVGSKKHLGAKESSLEPKIQQRRFEDLLEQEEEQALAEDEHQRLEKEDSDAQHKLLEKLLEDLPEYKLEDQQQSLEDERPQLDAQRQQLKVQKQQIKAQRQQLKAQEQQLKAKLEAQREELEAQHKELGIKMQQLEIQRQEEEALEAEEELSRHLDSRSSLEELDDSTGEEKEESDPPQREGGLSSLVTLERRMRELDRELLLERQEKARLLSGLQESKELNRKLQKDIDLLNQDFDDMESENEQLKQEKKTLLEVVSTLRK